MAEMRIKTFYLPALTSTSNKSLYFETSAQRNKFFDNIGVGRSYTYPYDVYIKDLDELVQTITLTGIDKDFVDTYAEIKDPDRSVERFYYYITDKKEIGNNTWEITLLLDTVTTYLGAGNSVGFNLTKNAIVTRRHKTRSFDETPEPYDFPLYVKRIQTNDLGDNRVRLVYRNRPFDKKPVAYIHSETIKEVDVEPAALDYPVEWNVLGLIQNTAMATTKTRWKGDVIIKNTSMFKHHTITGVYQPNTHYALGVVKHVSTNEWHPVLLVLNDSDGSVVTSWSLREQLGVVEDEPQFFTIQPLTTTGEELFVNVWIDGEISWANLISTYTPANKGNSVGKKNTWTIQDIDIYEPMIHRVIEIPGFMGMETFKNDMRGVYTLIDTPLKQQVTWQNPRNTLSFDVSKITKLRVPYNDKKLFTRQYMPSFYNHYGASIECTLSDEGTLYSNVATPNRFSFKLDMPYFGSSYIHNMLTATDGDKLTYTTDNTVITLKDEAYTYDQYYKDIEDRLMKRSEAAEKRNTVINSVQTGLTLFSRMRGLSGGIKKPEWDMSLPENQTLSQWYKDNDAYTAGVKNLKINAGVAVAGAGLSLVQGFMNMADSKKNNKDNLEIKLLGLLMSPTLTDGGDLDFNRDNNLDKPRIVTFGLLKEHLDFLDNVFHFTGYDTLEFMDLQAENFKTRKYFNYWQASLPIEGGNNYGFDDNIARDIVRRFENGVTIMHPQMAGLNFYKVADLTVATDPFDSVDWNQEYENWEV